MVGNPAHYDVQWTPKRGGDLLTGNRFHPIRAAQPCRRGKGLRQRDDCPGVDQAKPVMVLEIEAGRVGVCQGRSSTRGSLAPWAVKTYWPFNRTSRDLHALGNEPDQAHLPTAHRAQQRQQSEGQDSPALLCNVRFNQMGKLNQRLLPSQVAHFNRYHSRQAGLGDVDVGSA